MREHLIGYLLGALDPAEQKIVERELASDRVLRRQLEKLQIKLEALRLRAEPTDPPADLTIRTCETIEDYQRQYLATPASHCQSGAARYNYCGTRRWTLTDIVVAAGVCIAVSLLFFPAIANSRFQSQVFACQANLQQIAAALQTYNGYHANYFPPVPSRGRLAHAGCYAVLLRDRELIDDDRVFICPASSLATRQKYWNVPTLDEVQNAQGNRLVLLRQTMGGSYAYTLGHMSENGDYRPTRNLGRPYFVVMADAPSPDGSTLRSANHGSCGQNVLFEDFHVKYVVDCSTVREGDAIFVNHYGQTAAGVDFEDAVVGSSETAPVLFSPN